MHVAGANLIAAPQAVAAPLEVATRSSDGGWQGAGSPTAADGSNPQTASPRRRISATAPDICADRGAAGARARTSSPLTTQAWPQGAAVDNFLATTDHDPGGGRFRARGPEHPGTSAPPPTTERQSADHRPSAQGGVGLQRRYDAPHGLRHGYATASPVAAAWFAAPPL